MAGVEHSLRVRLNRLNRFGKLNVARQWRVVMTGVCFIIFFGGGLALNLTAFPLILLFSSTPEQKERRALIVIQVAFKFFMGCLHVLGPMASFKVHGIEHLPATQGCVFIANHPSLIDAVAILSSVPLCQCLVKKSILEQLHLGGLMRTAGYIANDDAVQLMDDCRQRLGAGRSLLIFPEGTRSPAHGLQPFTRGAAHIAIRAGAPVIPILISCHPPTLLKGSPWYDVPERPFEVTLRFLPPVQIPQAVINKPGIPLQVRAFTTYLEDFFQQQLDCHPTAVRPPTACNS